MTEFLEGLMGGTPRSETFKLPTKDLFLFYQNVFHKQFIIDHPDVTVNPRSENITLLIKGKVWYLHII